MAAMDRAGKAARYVYGALYVAAGLVAVDQVAELLVAMVPFRAGDVNWRFSSYGLLIGRTTILVLVDALVLLGAAGRSDGRVFRAVGLVHFALAALILGGLGLFGLDALELRNVVRPEAKATMLLASARTAVIAVAATGFAVWVGVVAWRAGGALRVERASGPVVVMGREKQA